MSPIAVRGIPGTMGLAIDEVPAFPGNPFSATFPEAIGDSARSVWYGSVRPTWTAEAGGRLHSRAEVPGELAYALSIRATAETVDAVTELTNRSGRIWRQSHAFNCFSPMGAAGVRDHDCVRHWVGRGGELTRLLDVPRKFGPRPTVQLYAVEGGPSSSEIPFVASFGCSPDGVALEPWIAIESEDGKRVVAVASKPCLYLFQNIEFSCIHAAGSFGTLAPGETGRSITRIWFVRSGIREWYARWKEEMARLEPGG
ncbi:MAG: hypothetical protein ACUVYA_20420 [Planctomycetota bacterium]